MTTPKWAKEGVEQVKDFVEGVNDKADAVADNAIDTVKAKTGRFTGMAILGGVIGIILLIILVKIL